MVSRSGRFVYEIIEASKFIVSFSILMENGG